MLQKCKNNFKSTIEYIINNKYYCLIMFAGFILLLLQMRNVVMYADDFSLKLISTKGWKAIFENQYNHYFTWGGGFTPILVTSFLMGKFYYWKIFITLLITSIVALTVKIFAAKTQKEKCIIAGIMWCSIFFLSVHVSRETLFWLDGSMAYVFTVFQVFLYIYYLITRLFNNITKKSDYIVIPLVSFFAGWSSAQTGAMTLIIPTLIILYAVFFNKIKVKKFYHIVNILGIIGFAIFYFAPGNAARMDVLEDFSSLGFFERIGFRLNSIFEYIFDFHTHQFNAMPFFLIMMFTLFICYGIYKIKTSAPSKKNTLLKVSTSYLLIIVLIDLLISFGGKYSEILSQYFINFTNIYNSGFSLLAIIQYGINFTEMFASLIIAFVVSKEEKQPSIIVFLIMAYLAQGVMVMAPYSEYRTVLISLIGLWIIIAYMMIILFRKKINILYLVIIPFIIFNVYTSVILLLCAVYYITVGNKQNIIKLEYSFICVLFASFALINYIDIYQKYRINRTIYEVNMTNIELSKNEKTVVMYDFAYPEYAFTGIVGIDWAEAPVRALYGLDDDVKFVSTKYPF